MLVKCKVSKWESLVGSPAPLNATSGTTFLLNGNNINGVRVRAFNQTQFMFVQNAHDFREKAAYIESLETLSNLKMRIDKTYQSLLVQIPFYIDNDSAKSTFNQSLNVDTISMVYEDPQATTTRAYVVYYEGGKKMTLLSSYDIRQIEALADSGTVVTSAG